MSAPSPGKLYLVPAPLDFGCDEQAPLDDALPRGTLAAAAGITHWICENAKSARAYLKRIDAVVPLAAPLQAQQIQELPREVHKKGDHAGQFDARPLLAPALAGHDVGLLSEAGMPAVADPGSSVARAAHDLGIVVVPLTGPVSLLLALAASGLNGQNFAFVGYLPQEADARTQRIRELESLALRTGQTCALPIYHHLRVWHEGQERAGRAARTRPRGIAGSRHRSVCRAGGGGCSRRVRGDPR